MKIKKGCYGGWFVVFPSSSDAYKYYWIFGKILRRRIVCFGQYENAYQLW